MRDIQIEGERQTRRDSRRKRERERRIEKRERRGQIVSKFERKNVLVDVCKCNEEF